MPNRGFVRLVCFAAVLLTSALVVMDRAPPPPKPPPERADVFSDRSLYRAITARVQAGENYYVAAAAEQRAHSYPTKPAVAFREPTEAWLLAALRYDFARWAAVFALAACAALAIHRALERQGLPPLSRAFGMALAATGLANAGTPAAPYLHEVWASLLIACSVAVWRPGRYGASIALAFAACLFREIAAPVLLAMGVCAVAERRWREAWTWGAATAAFGAVALAHLWLASRQALPADLTSPGWISIGGWRFILLTARRNLALAVLPYPATSVAVALALAGLSCADSPWSRRVAVVTFSFVGMFWFAGRPDNYYWGILYAPLLPLGLLYAARALRVLPPAPALVVRRRRRAPAEGA
jgi:hypothetical protein